MRSKRSAPSETTRPRWAVLVSGLVMVWITGWYTNDGSRALMFFSMGFTLFAALANRLCLNTTRAVIWSGVALLILTLSANIERITPPEDPYTIMRLFLYDRVVTVALVPALLALLLRPSRAAGTMIVAGCLPMVILVLAQGGGRAGAPDNTVFFMWSSLFLFVVVGHVQNLARHQSRTSLRVSLRELGWRFGLLTLALTFTALLAAPTSYVLSESADWISSKRLFAHLYRRQQGNFHLSLSAPPGGSSGGLRPVLSIKADRPPGYLRHYVYRDLVRGHWAQREANSPYAYVPHRVDATEKARFHTYSLPTLPVQDGVVERWRVQVLASRWRFAVALPKTVEALHLTEAVGLTINPDDVLNWQGTVSPSTYEASVRLNRENPLEELANPVGAAYPSRYPQLARHRKAADHQDPGYLRIPEPFRDEVVRWRSQIEHLDPEASPYERMQGIVAYFHQNFTYRLEGPASGRSDDLRLFMQERQGHCTLFATAAVLLLRASAIPARMVGGYLVTDPHPITGEYVARVRDGHAWCEAWDDEAGGWRRLEPTPAGGLPLGLTPPSRWRIVLETAVFLWRNFVEVAQQFNPILWIAETGAVIYVALEEFFATSRGRVLGFTLALLVGLGWRLRQMRQRTPRNPSQVVQEELISTMRRLERNVSPASGRSREPWETWNDWWRRTDPPLPPHTRESVRHLVADYQALRYRPMPETAPAKAWIKRVADVIARQEI